MKNPYLNGKFFERLEAKSLNLKQNLNGFFGGAHQVRKNGETVEFADFRDYVLGDDIRKIDWNLYSRFEHHYIKLFKDERQMHVNIYIDASKSMEENKSKKDYAIALAAALGFLAINNMDKVTFNVIKENRIESSPVIVGKNRFYEELHKLSEINFERDSRISEALLKTKPTGKDGISIIISDFLTDNDFKKGIDYLVYQKKQILLIQVLAKEEIKPSYLGRFNLIDSESLGEADTKNMRIRINEGFIDAYNEALNLILNDMKAYVKKREISYFLASTDINLDKVVFEGLMKVGLL